MDALSVAEVGTTFSLQLQESALKVKFFSSWDWSSKVTEGTSFMKGKRLITRAGIEHPSWSLENPEKKFRR